MELDLKAHRCPSAMTRTRMGIQMAKDKGETSLLIKSIEPMLESHIRAFINKEIPDAVVTTADSILITDEMKTAWEHEPEAFDEDDFDGTKYLSTYLVSL